MLVSKKAGMKLLKKEISFVKNTSV